MTAVYSGSCCLLFRSSLEPKREPKTGLETIERFVTTFAEDESVQERERMVVEAAAVEIEMTVEEEPDSAEDSP